jgi:hypothetical protein
MIVSLCGLLKAAPFAMPDKMEDLLANYCFDCHDDETKKGEVRLDNLATLALKDRLDLLNRVQEQIFIKEMPPRKRKAQPSDSEREQLHDWMTVELRKHKASRFEEKLRYPSYGNYLDHDKLFSGEIKDKPFSPARRWLVSPRIFHERVMNVLGLSDHEKRSFSTRQFYGVKNPFLLPDRSGVRDYDVTTLDGGHLLVMLGNAKWIADKQILAARLKTAQKEELLKGLSSKDRWYPKVTPEAFEKIVLKAEPPTDEEMMAAVEKQFDCVLMRKPTKEELAKYVDLLRSSIQLAGNSKGLRQMLFAVLLESDFLYRLELGGGESDQFGRRKLTPHEGSLAIAYALGDRSPDPELSKAAKEGRLESKEDYRREVERLLADQNYYKGPVDHKISGKNMRSHETSHPKIVRFFREFFGYPKAAKIFKDIERSDGYYQNPGRGTLGTPGFLIKEADRVVDWYLKKDEKVFENLLTSEEYFVYHDKDNETGSKIIEEWTQVYERLKDTEWKENPEKVIEENLDFLNTKKSVRVSGTKSKREFMRYMHFWGETIGKGRTPFTTPSFAHGYYYNHSVFYNLPPTPNPFRYGGVENKNHKGLDDVEFWDYPVEQPFEVSQRKGLLTHPAWLIAHSSNFHTDPIKRGRWIREKLLAGSVPDVPITVDAQIPEDPHKTLRERVESVTEQAECRKCHERMNPLGFPFEVFDDFGRYRLDEPLEYEEQLVAKAKKKNGANLYKTKSVRTSGALRGTGDSNLDGEVSDAFDLIDRLAKSTRVRQSIIRHAFRFYMGRNEMMSDAQTLLDADQAYVRSGGSFNEVIISLLTSDSFRYRK